MTDHKFTDEEVIKGLECCSDTKDLMMCQSCPYESKGCNIHLLRDALSLINRLKVEKKSFSEENKILRMYYGLKTDEQVKGIIPETLTMEGQIRAEAIKEFAERLYDNIKYIPDEDLDIEYEINNLVKEMTEENNESKST